MVTIEIDDTGIKQLLKFSPAQRREGLQACGMVVLSLAQRAFHEEDLRPIPWIPRKKNYAHPLMRKEGNGGGLVGSLRVDHLTESSVDVVTDKAYGAIHQYGMPPTKQQVTSKKGKKFTRTMWMPPRPYMPFWHGQLTEKADVRLSKALDIKLQKWMGKP